MGLINALVDAVKNAFSGGGSGLSASQSSSEINYDELDRNDSYDPYTSYNSGRTNSTSTPSYSNDSSAYYSINRPEVHNVDALPSARARADQNYQSAYNAYNDFITQNVGNNTNDTSDYYYQQDLNRLQQNLDKAEQTKNYFNPFVPDYTPNYQTQDSLSTSPAEDTRSAAQRAADIANERGQSRTNYLKTYMTEDSNWTKSKYLDENGNRLNSNPLITYDSNDQIPEIPEPRRSAEDEYNRKQQEYMMMNHDNSAYHQAQKEKDATQNLGEWVKNTIGAGATEWASGMIGKAGAAQGAAAAGTEKQYIDMMNEEWQALLKAGYAQAMDDDPRDKESNQNVVDDHMRKLKGYADAIGGGTFEQAYANYEKALEAVLNGEVDIEYALANMNDGVLPDLTTWQQASNATMGLATDVQQQSAEMMQNAKFAAGNTKVGDIATEVLVNNATQIADRLVTGVLTGGLGVAADAAQKAISLGLLYLRSSGSKATEAFNAGANNAQQNLAGDMSGAVEVLTEVLSDYVGNLYGKGIASDAAEETIRRIAKTDIGRTGLRILNAFKGEFKEEFVSAIVEPAINAVYDAEAADAYKTSDGRQQLLKDSLYEGFLGGLGGILGLGESSIASNANANANERLNDIDAIQQNLEDNGMSKKDAKAAAPAIHDYQQGEELSGKEKKAINNPIIQSLYGIDKSQIDAVEAAIKRGEITRDDVKAMPGASPDIIKEANKPRDNDKIDADIAAFNSHAQELATASVGDVVLDADNNPVATVTEVNDHGITVEFEDGHKNSAVFVGNNGLLDADSDLAKALGKDGEGAIVNAEEAKIFAQEAAARRKAQEEAKAAAANTPQQTTDSGTGTVAKPQQPQKPTKKAPTPGKPASMESADSGTGTSVTQQQAQQLEEQPVQKAPSPIKPASNESTDSGTGTVAASQTTNPLVQEERSTTGETKAEQQAPEAPKSKAQQFFDENPQKGRVYTSDYKGATVKIKNNGDGTYTVSMASPLKNGTGFTKAAKTIGTVSSIDEANQLVVDEYNKRNPGQKAFGETLGITPEIAPESPISASPETGNSVPTQTQESSETPNEMLNTGSEEDAAPATEENVGIKPYQNDDGSLIVDAVKVAEVVKGLSQDELTEAFFAYGEHGNDGKYSAARDAINRELYNRSKNKGSGPESETKTKAQKPLSQDDELALLDGGSTENTRSNKPEKTTTVGNTDYVTDSDTKAVNDLNNSKETYNLGDERYTAADVAKMSGGDILNRLKAWAKYLKLGGLRNFSTNLAQAIAGNKDYQGKNSQVEKSFSEVRGENGKIKNDFTNRMNLDRAAYEASQTKEGLANERANSAYMYLQGLDFESSLRDAIDDFVKRYPSHLRQAGKFIFDTIFRNTGIDVNTATVEDAVNALAPVTVEQALSSEESQLNEADREEISALLNRARDIEVRFGSGKYNVLSDILNGTAELTTSNDSNFAEGDFHGETVYGEQISAIQEDISNLRDELNQLQQLGNLGEENQQRVSDIVSQIENLEEQISRLRESEEAVENQSDQTVRNPLTENDYESVLSEDERRDATAARERRNKPELGSVSKNNASFIAESDVPAAHKEKGATGNFSRVRGIDVDGTTYYALVSEKNGSYRHIMPDRMVARAKNIFNRFNTAIEQKQRAVEYYRSMGVDQNPYAKGTDEYKAREKALANFDKAFNDLLDLQEKLDKISNGRYTFKDLWNDKSMPSDLRKAIAGEAAFANYNIQSVADAVLESDAIKGINAMKGVTNGRSSTETLRSDTTGNQNQSQSGRGNPLVPERTNGQLAGQSGRVQNQSNGVSQGWVSTLGYDGQTRPNESRRDAKQRVVREAKARARTLASEANSFLKSEGSVLGAFAAMQRRGYSGRVYNNGKMAVVTSGVKTIAHNTDQQSSLLSRILNKVRGNDTEAYMVDSVTIITQSGAVELGGITLFQNGKALIYASTEQGLLHESNHDDWERASDYIINNSIANDPIKWLDNRLSMICRTAGVDYNALKGLAGSQYSNDVVEEVYCELASLLYDNDSASFFDGSNGNYFTEAADKLRNNAAFARLVDTIDQYSDEQATLNYVENSEDQGRRVGEHVAFQKNFGSDDISPMDDESFQNLIDQENAYNNAALGEGTPIDQSDMDTLVNEASADEIDLLNSRGGNVSAEDIGRFNNLIDQASASEEETLNDLRNDSEDFTNASEGSFDNLVDTENQSIEDALNAGAESSANQYPERRFKDAKDYYGKAYDEVVSKVATKHARANSRSSFTHEDIYNKLYGNTPNARQNFRRLQKLNTNIDSLLKGKMSAQAFNAFIKNMMDEQGIGQILNDDIQKEFSELAKLEEKATNGDQHDSDVINFQYAAADAVAHLCARMDMVEKTERARAKLDSLAKEHGKTNKKAIGNAVDWWNRMQISGDNFWRMAGNWDAESRNQGYALAQEHNKCIATRISEEAKLKDYFSGIGKNSKEFRDFANGTTMSNVDFEGHKIRLMEAVKFVKICDTMRAFANENRRPDWQRVAALGGFAFEGKDGKPVFVDIQGSKKNNGTERVKWVQEHYDAAMAEIKANKAASEYMKACEEMYWDASQTAEKVHSKVNGYDRYMYGKGKYTDIHYANKNGTVDFSYKDRDAIDVHDTGIMQKRTRVNGGYVICNPMSRSIDAYISQISNYIAFEEFGQKLGVLNDSKSINGNYANTVGDAYGSNYSQWFDNYVKSMTLYRQTDPTKLKDKALQKARQQMMTGALSLSVSVPIKQVSSFFDTMGMLDPRAVGKVFATNPAGIKQKGINNYLYKSRGQSISDPDVAALFGNQGILGRFKNTGVGRTIMKATNIMDETAVSNVYMACVYDTEMNTLPADKLYKNGKNFKDGLTAEGQFYVDSKFEEVLLGTQPIFTPQARNELARTNSQLLRMFQTFRTQQTQNYNRALQSLNEWKAASKNGGDTGAAFKKVRQTVQGQLTASISLAALNAIANVILHKHHKYKDDDDEFDQKKFWKRFGLDALESFLGNALWLGDLTKWAIDRADISDSREFYGVASGALGTAWTIGTSAVDLYRSIQEDGWSQSNKVSARYLAGNVATALGKPLNNAYAILNAGWQWYADLAHIERKYEDIFLQWAYVTDTPQNRLANAILKGDNDQIADLIDEIGEDKLTNTVSYGALDKYREGKIDESEYVEILMNFANMSYKDANKEVQKKKALIDSGISQYNGIDGRDGRAAFYEQYSGNFKSRQAYKDFFADVKAGKADGKHKTYYTTYNGKQSEVTANQSSIIDRMNENIKAGNFDYNTAQLLWENYYGYSTYKGGAWQYVGR